MNAQQWVAIASGAAGTLGSVLTAFSVSRTLTELKIARGFIAITLEALARGMRNIPVFEGIEPRLERAAIRDAIVLWAGVLLLAAGFILQAVGMSMK